MCSPVWQVWSLNGVYCQTPVLRARKWWIFLGIELRSNKLTKNNVNFLDFTTIHCQRCTSCLIFHLDGTQNLFAIPIHFFIISKLVINQNFNGISLKIPVHFVWELHNLQYICDFNMSIFVLYKF